MRFAGLVALSSAWIGCQHAGLSHETCAGQIADVGGAPRTLHVRAELTRGERSARHELVLRVGAGRITAIGLTPLGTRAFTLSHGPAGLEIDDRIGRRLGQSPALVYDAIAHALLAPPEAAPAGVLVRIESGAKPRAMRVTHPGCGYEARIVVLSEERVP